MRPREAKGGEVGHGGRGMPRGSKGSRAYLARQGEEPPRAHVPQSDVNIPLEAGAVGLLHALEHPQQVATRSLAAAQPDLAELRVAPMIRDIWVQVVRPLGESTTSGRHEAT